MGNSLLTEMTFKIRLIENVTDEQISKENVEKAEKIVGYKMFNEDETLTNKAKEGQFGEILGMVKSFLDSEDVDIIDYTCDKCELIK